MAQIVFNIPSDKLPRIIAAMVGFFPVPQVNTGTEEEPVWEPEFTNSQWAKESVRRWIVRQVQRWETRVAMNAVDISEEDDIVS